MVPIFMLSRVTILLIDHFSENAFPRTARVCPYVQCVYIVRMKEIKSRGFLIHCIIAVYGVPDYEYHVTWIATGDGDDPLLHHLGHFFRDLLMYIRGKGRVEAYGFGR